jgi:peptidoglycan hydrolase-like protein with peptidoglycan-binding domain
MKRLVALLLALTMFAACMPAFAEEDGAIRYADRGDQVIKLQERLIQLGFLTGEADGQYGKKTQSAVLSFHKLLLARAGGDPSKATGRSISAEDLEVLYADPFSFYVSDLKLDDQGDEVERLQSALIRLNYLDDKATGNFGENTLEAVKYFQKLNNLPVTGVADKATQDLAATATTAAERPAYKEVQKGDKGKTVRAMQQKLVELGLMEGPGDGIYGSDTTDAINRFEDYLEEQGDSYTVEDANTATTEFQEKLDGATPVFLTALKSGSKDVSEVKRLQRRLNALGYIGRLTIDGQYGSGVKDAITLFQGNNGLPQTGEADEATQKLLYSKDAVGMLTKYRLSVILSEQKVYVYELNAEKKYDLINTFACSTGYFGPTPTGVFTTTGPYQRWHYFKDFAIWAQYAYHIEGDILFHSVLYKKKGGSPTWGSVHSLGNKASHGCVRLSVENAKWLYEHCEAGTVVTIY